MKKVSKNIFAVGALAALMVVGSTGGVLAYLTDSEKGVNTFTIGDVTIELLETQFPGNDSSKVKNIVPNEEVNKDPLIDNKGTTDAIVLMTLDSPIELVTVITDDGSIESDYAASEVFWFKDSADSASKHETAFDDHWIELNAHEKYVVIETKNDGSEVETELTPSTPADLKAWLEENHPSGSEAKPTKRLVKRYVFGYDKKLEGSDSTDGSAQTTTNKKTTTLFEKVQLKNIIEGEIDESIQNVVVRAYGIQASKIMDNGTDISQTLNATNLSKIYTIFVQQNSTGNDSTGLKVENLRDADYTGTTDDGASGSKTQHVNRWDTTLPSTDDPMNPNDNINPNS